jgi:hypothetical protein
MPKNNIDYSNTVIYKIYCKDQSIQDIYVGHTTNFIKRKYQHKILSSKIDNKIYKTIRENGGWENWNMVELAVYNCKDSTEARIREQEYYELLKPTLNTLNPVSNDINKITTFDPSNDYKNAKTYYCDICDYTCFKKFNLDKHLLTAKHLKVIEGDTKVGKNSKSSNDANMLTKYICQQCNKKYSSRNGIWKHNKLFHNNDKEYKEYKEYKDIVSDKELIMTLIKENSEFKSMIMKLIENGTNNTNTTNNTTTNHINSHNKSFNLNLYLNETCKDAMNITDFVNSIQINLEDLENTGRKGYIEGISNIIVKNLNNIEDHLRPLHCSDGKREILYIKDNDKWEKETDDKPILTKAIKFIANENIKQIKNWREKYPDCTSADSRKNDLYLKIVSNSMNGLTAEESKKNINKIISNLAKETIIKKDNIL